VFGVWVTGLRKAPHHNAWPAGQRTRLRCAGVKNSEARAISTLPTVQWVTLLESVA
jgi:hypothetical protein